MKCEIWLEGNKLDLDKELDVKLSYLINDIRDASSRQTNFSKTIVLSGTAQNNFIFGNVFDVKISNAYNSALPNVGYNFNAAKSAQAVIYVDKVQVFKGVLRVLEVVIDKGLIEYEVSVHGELGGLVFALGDKYLTALDFSAYDHTYNLTNITGTWSAPLGSGYYYPLIDYGIANVDNVPYEMLRPALHVKEYIDKLFAAAGYTYESSFFDSDFFKKLIVPNNADRLWIETEKLFYWQHPQFSSAPQTVSGTPYTITYVSSIGTQYLPQASGKITYNRDVEGSVRIYSEVLLNLVNTSGSSQYVEIRAYKNDFLDTGVFVSYTVPAGATVQPLLIIDGIVKLVKNDTIKIAVNILNLGAFSTRQVLSAIFYGGGTPVIRINTQIGDTIKMNTTIPKDVKQKDFLSSIVGMFNLYIDEDETKDKHVKISPYPTFYANGFTNRKDWSNKIDVSRPIKIKPVGELASKSYYFKYKKDADYYNEIYYKKYGVEYGQRIYDTGLDFVQEQKKIELLFAPSVMVQYTNDDKVMASVYKSDGIVKEQYVSLPRLLLRKSAATTCGSWNVVNGATVIGTYTSYPYAGHLDDPTTPTVDILFGAPNEVYFSLVSAYPSANLFNDYYSGYVSEISNKDSKLLTAYFKLTSLDIQALNFGDFIFIDGTLYRLNKITDYDAINEQVCECELLTVMNY